MCAPPAPYRASLREAVRRALEEVGPATLALHDGAGRTGGLAEGLAGQLHLAIFALGHVDGAEQGLDDIPAAWGVAKACEDSAVTHTYVHHPPQTQADPPCAVPPPCCPMGTWSGMGWGRPRLRWWGAPALSAPSTRDT